jgi:hypothetical protein
VAARAGARGWAGSWTPSGSSGRSG